MGQITIVHCGVKNKNGIMSRVLRRALSAYGGVQWFDGAAVSYPDQTPRFLLYECTGIPQITSGAGILVFDNGFVYSQEASRAFSDGFVPILEGENKEAAKALKGTGKIAVTCSPSARGTLSIASLDYERAAVSLQRDLRILDGSVVEPMEIIVGLSQKTPAYPLMAACGILLLSGVEGSYYF